MSDESMSATCQRDPNLELLVSTTPLPQGGSAVALAIMPGPRSREFKGGHPLNPVAVWLSRDDAGELRDFLTGLLGTCSHDPGECERPSGDVEHDCPTEQAGRDGRTQWVCECGSIWHYGVSKRGNGTWRLATNEHGGYEERWTFASFDPATRRQKNGGAS